MTDTRSSSDSVEPILCPFCGSVNLTLTTNRNGWKIVECDDCGACGPCIENKNEDYIERWNDRIGGDAQAAPEPNHPLERLWRAIENNATDESFWMAEILLHEITKETGYSGYAVSSTDRVVPPAHRESAT